jgi:hypothetical protein
MVTGYSGTPLLKKLGIKAAMKLAFLHEPEDYLILLGALPDGVQILDIITGDLDFIHAFYKERAEFEAEYSILKNALRKDGMLWISWPKKASKLETDITEDVIREFALANGLVDVKVAAIDAVWSGLKLVYRTKDR